MKNITGNTNGFNIIPSGQPPNYNIITFDKSSVGQNNEYKIMLINEMGHMFANGTNNPKGVICD